MRATATCKRIMFCALLTGGIAFAELGLAATAQAQVPHHWCPGDTMVFQPVPQMAQHTGPGTFFGWDMNICHTWFWVRSGMGNVPFKGSLEGSNVWDGETPPPNSDPGCGNDMFTGRPGTC